MQKPRSALSKKVLPHLPKAITIVLKSTLVLMACFFYFSASAQVSALENSTLTELMEHRTHGNTEFWQGISNTTNYTSMSVPLVMFTAGMITHDAGLKKNALYVGETIAVSSAVTFAMKFSIKRNRPAVQSPFITAESNGGSPSFPSGHTSEAFATATAISMSYPKWYVIVPAYAWASSVGYSRVYLGVHYPTDVLTGAVVGIGSAYITKRANLWLQQTHKQRHLIVP